MRVVLDTVLGILVMKSQQELLSRFVIFGLPLLTAASVTIPPSLHTSSSSQTGQYLCHLLTRRLRRTLP